MRTKFGEISGGKAKFRFGDKAQDDRYAFFVHSQKLAVIKVIIYVGEFLTHRLNFIFSDRL